MNTTRTETERPPRRRSWPERIAAVVLGLLIALLLLEGALRLGGHLFLMQQDARNRRVLTGADTVVVLCLGESTTALGGEESFPSQLQDVLDEWGGNGRFSVINKGIPGTDSSVILEQLGTHLDAYQPQIVVAMMGANDMGGAIPFDGVPMVEQTGFPRGLKTYRLLRLVQHRDGEETEPASTLGAKPPPPGEPGKAPLRPRHRDRKARPDLPSEGQEARRLADAGDETAATRAFQIALEAYPDHSDLLVEAARHHERRELHGEAEAAFRRATDLAPDDADAWFGLGRILRKEERFEEAAVAFEHAVEADASDPVTHASLALCYEALGRVDDAQRSLERSLALDPGSRRTVIRAIDFYDEHDLHQEALTLFGRIEREHSPDHVMLGRIARYHQAGGDRREAQRVMERADLLRHAAYCSTTRDSYRQLHAALRERDILLAAVQYPTRPAEPLRRLFESDDGLLVVDNEASFEEAILETSFSAIFSDACYGDFGHATARGNRMLAENVARRIFETWLDPAGSADQLAGASR